MRNIKIVQKQRKSGTVFRAEGQSQSPVICLGDHGSLLVCCNGVLSKFPTEDVVESQVLCDNPELLQDLVQMQFVSSTGMTYLVNGRGSFLQLMMHDNGLDELFQSEEGILYFSVSPDSRFVVIVTKQNTLLLLTLPDLEVISQQILVEGEGGELTDTAVVVWREDAHYFAVNYKQNEKFQIKVFDENGEFHSKTEDENALLDSVLEWQPSGGLIAGIGKTPHGTVVSLFERNGLKRADFFPYEGKKEGYEDNKIIKLSWNTTSDILAIAYIDKVELWCRNNYVWMRKLVLNGSGDEVEGVLSKLTFVGWDQERNNRLHVVDGLGVVCVYDITFTYTSGYSSESSIVASWNGNAVYCTPFRNSCCPPPHCLFQTTYAEDIKAVVVPEFWSGYLCVTAGGEFIFSKYSTDGIKQIRTLKIPVETKDLSQSYNWLWPNRSTICSISSDSLTLFQLRDNDFEDLEKEIKVEASRLGPFNEAIVSAFVGVKNKEDSSILLQTQSGIILKVNLSDKNSINLKMCKFPHVCSEVQLLCESFVVGHDPLTRKLMVGWSKYPDCEPIILSNDCTSFVTFQHSVIYTTVQGFLEARNEFYVTRLLEKHILGHDFNNAEESIGRYTRKCEKGSMIVRCCLSQMLEPTLILQIIPRGNLEIIYPRPLIIDTVKVIMREKENNTRYEKIMAALRRHRIDYRVLIDEMRVLVKEDTEYRLEELLKTMIEQVKNSHSLVLLVTDLNQDYSDCILAIKNVLEGVLKDAGEKRMAHVEEAYLASMAKLGLLEEALKSTLILGEREENRELVQHRVKFLSFYCENQDVLFDTALGTYDLGLASLVADCLGKDPKEYIPVLDGFQSMLELKRRFKIDDKLRRYAKAVINLIKDQRVQHDEIVKYMERHRLFTDVITFLNRKLKYDEGGVVERSGDDTGLLLRESLFSYAQYLEERGKLLEASILYRDSENFEKAIECSTKSCNWEFALEVAYEKGSNADEIKNIILDVLVQLEDRKMFGDAARICESYLNDLQQAVYFYIKDKKWQRASTLALKSPSLGAAFRNETVKPKLMDAGNEQREIVEQMIEDIETKVQRLRRVKEIKAEKLVETGGFLGDAFSDTESFMSGSSTSGSISSSNVSGKSYRSGKNKRKQERKVYSMKEGSKYEDLAIIAHLWNVLDKVQSELKPDVSNTIESLWKFDESEAALILCDNLEKLMHVADKCVHEVWSEAITEEVLEAKFRLAPVSWSPAFNKLALHDPSSKATTR